MWELLYCPYCNETAATTLPAQWGSTVTTAVSATTVMSAKVTECLLQYETAMQDTVDEISKNLTYAPVFADAQQSGYSNGRLEPS
jgi:BRCT domain type II-containing protein